MWTEELEIIQKTVRAHDRLINELLGKVNRLLALRGDSLSRIKDRKLRLLRAIYDRRERACLTELANAVGVSRKTLMKDLVELGNAGLVSYAIFGKRNNPGRSGNIPRLTARGGLIA
jgi:DNA-binding transcriptional ArsR family regulator